jgi:hypothetical protein
MHKVKDPFTTQILTIEIKVLNCSNTEYYITYSLRVHSCVIRVTCTLNHTIPVVHNKASKSVNFDVLDFDLPSSPILIPQFLPFMTGSDKSGEDNAVRDAAYPSLPLLRISLSFKKVLSV